jgi:hypothetical protein
MHGSVFVYRERDLREAVVVDVAWAAGHGHVTITKMSPTITRVDYEGSDGAVLRVENTSYTLSSQTLRPRVPRVEKIRRIQGQWTCSSYDYLSIAYDAPTAAVRARWTRGGRVSEFWMVGYYNQVELGKVNCGGTTIPPSELDRGGSLELIAILFDGSEHLMTGIPHFWTGEKPRAGLILAILMFLVVLASARVAVPRVASLAIRNAAEPDSLSEAGSSSKR